MIDPARLSVLLQGLGVDVTDIRGSEVVGLCPGHLSRTGRRDHSPSWSVNADKQTHYCFSCGFSGSLVGLVAEVGNMTTSWGLLDYDAARAYLEDHLEVSLAEVLQSLEKSRDGVYYLPKPVPMSEARLAVYGPPPAEVRDPRRLSLDACQRYGVRFDLHSYVWILPLRDPDDDFSLMGWQEKGAKDRFFKNRPAGLEKSRTLFGLDAFRGPQMVVVESPLDAVRLGGLSAGGVAVCGSKVSARQYALMQRADRLIVAFDNPAIDDAGRKALEMTYDASRRLGFDFWAFRYDGDAHKDIGTMSDDEIGWGIDNAVHCLRGLRALAG